MKVVSKTNFEDLKSIKSEESKSSSESGTEERLQLDSSEVTIFRQGNRKKPKKILGLKPKDFEAKIPVSIKESDREFQLQIPVKFEEKKDKPKHKVKFYKGTKMENETTTVKPKKDPLEERVPIVKGSFSDVKPDFLVPIPRETVPRDINSLSPLNDFQNLFKHVAGRLRTGKPNYIEGLRPPPPSYPGNRPFLVNRDPYDRRNCSYSYSGHCNPSTDGYPYPDVGTETPFPRPTYGVPNWQRPNDYGNDWSSEKPGTWGQGNHQGNDWGGGGWSQNRPGTGQGNQQPWNQGRPVYGPPSQGNDHRRPWNPTPQGEWNKHQGTLGTTGTTGPVRLNNRRGSWISCKPFEIFSGREAREEPPGCPQHVSFVIDFPTATPASKIDDKTFFGNENGPVSPENEPSARLIFPSNR